VLREAGVDEHAKPCADRHGRPRRAVSTPVPRPSSTIRRNTGVPVRMSAFAFTAAFGNRRCNAAPAATLRRPARRESIVRTATRAIASGSVAGIIRKPGRGFFSHLPSVSRSNSSAKRVRLARDPPGSSS
jgi:hypothetical protein